MHHPIDDCVIVVDMARIGGTGWMMDKDKSPNHKEILFCQSTFILLLGRGD
jgi:hypothetical protein